MFYRNFCEHDGDGGLENVSVYMWMKKKKEFWENHVTYVHICMYWLYSLNWTEKKLLFSEQIDH